MPNTNRGGGVSRKITSIADRRRLKDILEELEIPEGMGVIVRTAGAERSKAEIKRDYEYLLRLWNEIRELTLKSTAPALIYEEGNLIKRSIRDLYTRDIDEVLVEGEEGYKTAKAFMRTLMPSHAKRVQPYRDPQVGLFHKFQIESQIDAVHSPVAQLRSGGYVVINQTEALVSIDVNSGRSTREHHIEDTALKTNLEASEEVARQLRLRDLAGLIVIDFIDMDEKRNNRAVERKLSDCLRQDRARIQVGRISHFGLLEMSRQRIRASVLESSTDPCTHCGGTGHVRSVSSVALQLLRGLEEILMKGATHNLVVRTRTDVALYVLNHKRGHLRDLETGFKVTLSVIADPSVSGPQAYVIDRGEQVHTLEAAKALLAAQAAASPPPLVEEAYDDEEFDPETESEVETEETEGLAEEQTAGDAATEQDGQRRKRRRRRRGRGGPRDEETREDGAPAIAEAAMAAGEGEEDAEAEPDGEEGEEQAARGEQQGSADRRRRRGRRGGRRRRGPGEEGLAGSISDELGANAPSEATDAVADFDGFGGEAAPSIAQAEHTSEPQVTQPEPRAEARIEATAQPEPAPSAADEEHADDKAARRRSTVREKVSFLSSSQSEPAPVAQAAEPVAPPAPAPEPAPAATTETSPAPRRAGWWSRRFGGGE
jgi:ribonuclease E